MWRCCGRLHVLLLRGRWALTASQTGVAVRLHGAPTTEPCERHAQRHWDCGSKQPRVSFGASGICWPQLGGASGMLHRTGVVMAPRRGSRDGSDAAARHVVRSKVRPQWTMSSTVEEILRGGNNSSTNMKLNDFLRSKLGGRGVVDTNRSVLLKEFFKDPKKYIRNKGVLKEIQASEAYARMEGAVKGEIIFEKDRSKLRDKGVNNLLGWSEAAANVKKTVHKLTKNFLDAAAEEARNPTTTGAPEKLEGLYESVHNARWSHVVELPDSKKKKTGTGMNLREGKPPQPWKYRAVGDTLEKRDFVQQSGAARLRLMVLTSEKGWPYSWNLIQGSSNDFFVNCEVDRVWQIVKRDLTKWFSNFRLTLNSSPVRRLLIGTPGIGKSVAAGSYLLYQLLHYDIKKLQVVVHCFGDTAYVFDKTAKTVTKYMGNKTSSSVLRGLRQRGMKGYIIYDVATQGTPPDTGFAPSTGWGMIVVSSPKATNYDEWEKQTKASRIIMNCPDEVDVKAMCTWMKRDETPGKKAEYWKKVKERMDKVGPIPRYIFDENEFIAHSAAIEDAVDGIKSRDGEKHFTHGGVRLWDSEDPSHKLLKVVRVRENGPFEDFANAPICMHLGILTVSRLAKVLSANDILSLVLGMKNVLEAEAFKKYALNLFLNEEFVTSIAKDLKELPPPSPSKPRPSVLTLNPHGYPTEATAITELGFIKGRKN
ncbi:retrotransposon hot spot (RHS) protein, putative [Trypanosoma cruzi]|nr:retrotransposon hot spot (RHS) protein, putative [Trypanosoma cruzi]